jgi:hypothetical protein
VVTVPDGLEQCDAGGRDPQAGAAQLLGGGRKLRSDHAAQPIAINARDTRKRMLPV